jgi:CheY-like chemotaxis protein
MSHPPMTILVIDDEPGFASALAGVLRRDGHTADRAENGTVALTKLQTQPYDLLFCDLLMPELDGPAFFARLAQQYPHLCPRVIFLTGDTLGAESRAFLEQCGQPWVQKPCGAAEIRSAMAHLQRLVTR